MTGPSVASASSRMLDRVHGVMTGALLAVALTVALAGLAVHPAAAGSGSTTVSIIITGVPALTVTKRGTVVDVDHDGRIGAGDRVRWMIRVSNTGETLLTAVTVSDPKNGPVRCPTATLVAGQAMACTVPDHTITAADVDVGVLANIATATATGPTGPVVATPGVASVRIRTIHPFVPIPIFPVRPVTSGLPAAPAGRPGSTGPATGGGGAGHAEPEAQPEAQPGAQPGAQPPAAVAGGQPDVPGPGGLTMVLLGAATAAGALAALATLGILGGRRTRRRR